MAARSAGFIHGQGPSSKARRAASMARTASCGEASGTLPMTASVAGSITSIDPIASLAVHSPSMKRS